MTQDGIYRAYNESYAPTPTARRRMPQIPTKRSASRQSSVNEENYDGFRTPENSSHRGASLPPTPTKTPKILARLAAHNKPFNSLPPTPGRQLPKPNVNHRSAKARRNSLMKRTNSADYSDNNVGDNYYMRPGAVSAREMYNEDYNYAYQSTDNLEQVEVDLTPVQNTSENRTIVIAESTNLKNGGQYQQYSSEDYYYSAQEECKYEQDYYLDDTQTSQRRKKLNKRGNSPLLQQNTDSLESRDDELKDSFETAVSSISSSLYQQRRGPYSEYSTADENMSTNVTPSTMHLEVAPKPSTTTAISAQYHRDQIESPQAIVTSIVTSIAGVGTVQTNNNIQAVPFRNTNQTRGYLQQQDTIDASYYHQESEVIFENEPEYIEKDSYLDNPESVESYTEDVNYSNGISGEYNNKAINRDSPASVIHVEHYDDEQGLARDSTQVTVIDPYHPSAQRASIDTYVPSASRRTSLDPYRSQSPSQQISGDLYPPVSTSEDFYVDSPPRKPSVIDTYQIVPARRASIRHSPPKQQDSIDQQEVSNEEEVLEKKNVSFEDEEEKTPRPKITAQQRWLWAYNKIIMQLNVSEKFY